MAAIFDRLIGLETEYAVRFRPRDPSAPRFSRYRIYEAVVAALEQSLPTAKARHFKEGVFLANGGAVWFEAERPADGGGLIEGATPECRSPKQLVVYQRAQDELLAQAAHRVDHLPGELQLIKNDRDARGNVYGAQENYEVDVASGLWLWLWRLGLLLLFPLAIVTWAAIAVCLLGVLIYFAMAGLVYVAIRGLVRDRRFLAVFLFGSDLADGRSRCVHAPVWLESTLQFAARVVTGPLALVLYCLIRATVFRRIRRSLLPFLVSRPVLAGAGMLDRRGRFHLSDKGPAINCTIGFGGFCGDRPIFNMGHFFKAIYANAWFSPTEYARLFSLRQRLQIGIGDSNMCEAAEYLRVGTTLLMLDAIEAGAKLPSPRLHWPIASLHKVCRDEACEEHIARIAGQSVTAAQLQRRYYEACRQFVASRDDAPDEAREVLDLWRQALDGVDHYWRTGRLRLSLVGMLDWVTKKHLIDEAGKGGDWQERKKIDLRYHELSPGGYYQRLRRSGLTHRVASADAIERAMRVPPSGTPATVRGHYIREFTAGEEPMMASWTSITFGTGWSVRTVPLRRQSGKSIRGTGNARPSATRRDA